MSSPSRENTNQQQQHQSSHRQRPLQPSQRRGESNPVQRQPQKPDNRDEHPPHRQESNSASSSASVAALSSARTSTTTSISAGRKTASQFIHPKTQSAEWLVAEMLKRTDLSSGDICLYHYPTVVVDMARAFDMILEGGNENLPPDSAAAASEDARNQVVRIQFSWYQFEEFPREVLGRTYVNLQHLDIRQNASLTCIDSLISQLPHLSSLNLSDCPNILTLAPLATALTGESTLQQAVDDASSWESHLENQPDLHPARRRTLSLRHLWVRGCNLSHMSNEEWSDVFDALSESSGPLERLTLSRNNMSYLHGKVGKLRRLGYLFVEDNHVVGGNANFNSVLRGGSKGFELPDELGDLSGLRFASFCGNNLTSLPRTMGRLRDDCDLYVHRNPNLTYPPPECKRTIVAMRQFFHQERMALLRGAVLFMPHRERARRRAAERLYRPGGRGYVVCKESFEESVRRSSIILMAD